MSKLIVLRGLPGSGKSDMAHAIAQTIPGACIASVDKYFERSGEYKFRLSCVAHSYGFVQGQVDAHMQNNAPLVIADGVHASNLDIEVYKALADKYGYEFEIKFPDTPTAFDPVECHKHSTHKVPLHTIVAMAKQFERNQQVA